MTSKKTGPTKKARKLKLKKETLKDLDAGRRSAKVKGGDIIVYNTPGITICLCITVITKCGQTVCATGNMFCAR